MRKIIFSLCVLTSTFLLGGDMLITGKSDLSVADTSKKLQNLLKEKGVNVFAVIEHSKEAKKVSLDMSDTEVVVFGAPKAGTPLMQCEPKLALELPLKMLIYANKDGKTEVAYESLQDVAKRYDASKCQEIINKLSKAQENFFKAITK